MNRYRYERNRFNAMTQRNRNAAAAAAAAAREKRNLNLAEIQRLRVSQHAARNTEAAFGAKKRELQRQAGLRTGMFDWAKRNPQLATSPQAQAFNAQQRTTLTSSAPKGPVVGAENATINFGITPKKKPWYKLWGKGGRKSRKTSRKSRKGSRKSRKTSRRN
jgi:hypothetical protein